MNEVEKKEIEEMAKAIYKTKDYLEEIDYRYGLFGNADHFHRIARKLTIAGYGKVEEYKKETATLEQFDTGCDSYWTCSNCGEDYCFIEGGPEENEYRYCPHCGAKITKIIKLEDKEKEDEQE